MGVRTSTEISQLSSVFLPLEARLCWRGPLGRKDADQGTHSFRQGINVSLHHLESKG